MYAVVAAPRIWCLLACLEINKLEDIKWQIKMEIY